MAEAAEELLVNRLLNAVEELVIRVWVLQVSKPQRS